MLLNPTVLTSKRAPAVPLVVHDPYFSTWSFEDELTHDRPRHSWQRLRGAFENARHLSLPYTPGGLPRGTAGAR